jgi:hypothetical protein
MSVLADVATFVGGSALLLAAFAWLLRTALSHTLQRDLAEFKARLEATATAELERVRSQLRLVEAERSKQSTLLLEKRAAVIDTLYTNLIDYLGAAESFSSLIEWEGEPSKEEKAKVLGEKSEEFFGFFLRHRIYFTAPLCDKIQHLHDTVRVPMLKYRAWLSSVKDGAGSGGKLFEAWEKAAETIRGDIPPLMHAIEAEFRLLLGVTKGPQNDG